MGRGSSPEPADLLYGPRPTRLPLVHKPGPPPEVDAAAWLKLNLPEADFNLVRAGLAELSRTNPELAERLARRASGFYGERSLAKSAAALNQALTGDPWERAVLDGQFPEECSVCGEYIATGSVMAQRWSDGAMAHNTCTPEKAAPPPQYRHAIAYLAGRFGATANAA